MIVHDISLRRHILRVSEAHKGKITGLSFADEDRLLSCGVDRNVKLWDTRELDENDAGPSKVQSSTDTYTHNLTKAHSAPQCFPREDVLQVSLTDPILSSSKLESHFSLVQ